MKKNLLLIALAFSFVTANAQDSKERKNKGRIYASYGLNRTAYDLSTLHAVGDGYDFSLTHYDANDGFSEYDFAKFNGKLGYFITEHLSIAVGYDNFTYRQINNGRVKIGGTISDTMGGFDAEYQANQDQIKTSAGFITYEYAKLNYINLNLEVHDDFWVSKNGKFAWSYYFGIGGGIVMAESSTSLFGATPTTSDKGAGYGGNASFGTKFHLGPVFLDLGGKAGYIEIKDVPTDGGNGLSKHNFLFASGIASIGLSFNLSK